MPNLVNQDEALLLIEDEVEEVTYECDFCGADHGDDEDAAYGCCRHSCPSCGTEYRYEEEAADCCMYHCAGCGAAHEYEEDAIDCCRDPEIDTYGGSAPYLAPMQHHLISVPEIEGRPARLCSLEQELADGGRTVAALLYEQGVVDENVVYGYHWSGSRPGIIHVESDGSLPAEGGEIIYDRFNLARTEESETLSKVVGKIRQLRDEHKLVKTSFAAGIHVHIAAKDVHGECLSPRDMAALYELWSYAEDMLYSLSAAGWNRHRQPTDSYGGYCKAVPKVEGTANAAKVWRAMRSDRYYGLNFQRLFNAASRCSCGAGEMGDWNSCDCGAMDGATVEWRVFNASTLPRTIHAWLLMAHAITAYSREHEIGSLPTNEYGSQSRDEKREVLNHLLDVLPLTEGEKDVILDAADRSPGL